MLLLNILATLRSRAVQQLIFFKNIHPALSLQPQRCCSSDKAKLYIIFQPSHNCAVESDACHGHNRAKRRLRARRTVAKQVRRRSKQLRRRPAPIAGRDSTPVSQHNFYFPAPGFRESRLNDLRTFFCRFDATFFPKPLIGVIAFPSSKFRHFPTIKERHDHLFVRKTVQYPKSLFHVEEQEHIFLRGTYPAMVYMLASPNLNIDKEYPKNDSSHFRSMCSNSGILLLGMFQ